MFHARKWGWKRLAAKLLLIPVIGGWAGVAHGQFKTGEGSAGASPAMMPGAAARGDYKGMLKDGRKALAAGQYDRAQDLARAAEANNPTGKWGLFDDTPRSLLEDVQKAVAKAQKAQGEQMMKEAKSLLARPPQSEAERAANLDRAFQLAQRADQLHGPYSAWELGDRPDKLMKEIQTARGRARTMQSASSPAPGTQTGAQAVRPAGGASSSMPASGGVKPAGGTSADPRKAAATQLMAEAKALADKGQFGAARGKLVEADKIGASFTRDEPTPAFALQNLNERGAAAITTLVGEARSQLAKKDFEKTDAALRGAVGVATALGLYQGAVKDVQGQLWAASGGKYGVAAQGTVATGGPETLVPVGPGPLSPVGPGPVGPLSPVATGNPANPPGVATVGGTSTNPPGTASVGGRPTPTPGAPVGGRQLLDQAAIEFRNNDLEMATNLARQAYNLGGVKEEASALLNSIDAERLAQKRLTAVRSFEAAQTAYKNRDYNHALGVLVLIDPNLLAPESKARHASLVADCRTALGTPATGVATAGGTQDPAGLPAMPGMGDAPPGTARVGADPKVGGADNLAAQQDALRRVQFQKLRSEGLKIQTDAQAAFGRGETDLAIQMLADYANRVRASGMEPASIAMLLRPIDSRLDMFRVMKGQADAVTRVNRESREARDIIAGRGQAEEQRRAEVTRLVRDYHDLVKQAKYRDAEKCAMQAKQLDPDNPALGALAHMAKMQGRVREAERIKGEREEFVLNGLNRAEMVGPSVDTDDPVSIRLDAMRRAQRRGSLDNAHVKTRTAAEFEIEQKLDRLIPIEINQTPLDQAIDHLRTVTNLPISIDTSAISSEGINLSTPITEKLTPVATRHVLTIILEKAGLSYVVENDVVKVTTTKKAKGRLFTKVFSVADLVTPIPNFALPDYADFDKMINQTALSTGRAHIQGVNTGSGPTPFMPPQGLAGGTAVLPGSQASMPGISGGSLQSNNFASQPSNPLGGSAHLAGERNTKHEQLIKLITGMVRPYSWDGMGGPGRVEYFDIGSALVVNQVADVIQEVADLLEALRRLQDLAIAVEIRIVSLSETWFERMGVDFSMNIKTHNTSFEPALTQIDPNTGASGVFRPTPFINSLPSNGATIGLTPAGTFTGDLGVPIRPNTFNRAVPPFGGYPNTPGNNGGVSFGLAFLNDIQVFMFMEAAQGDRRVNVMQAPKLTLFNGQTATLSVSNTEFFVTNVTVISVNGQLVFTPQNTPLPGPGDFAQGGSLSIGIQAVVSADRRFVRMNLPVNLSAQTGATVPLFPITTFVTPVFEGGSQGLPIPFTQFLQQPSFTNLNIQTTVVCPDGGTVLLGGLKTLSEGRNEFGPPFLSKIPYLNRLFKNVGIGRETRHIMLMVTPRIIINSEEEIFQTEGRPPTGGQP